MIGHVEVEFRVIIIDLSESHPDGLSRLTIHTFMPSCRIHTLLLSSDSSKSPTGNTL